MRTALHSAPRGVGRIRTSGRFWSAAVLCRFGLAHPSSYSSCEVVLLDVRTGLVPFARVISRERMEVKLASDMDTGETRRRAEQGATTDALNAVAEELAAFLKDLPK